MQDGKGRRDTGQERENMSISAVRGSVLRSSRITGCLNIARNMSVDWKTKKEKFLSLKAEEKRQFYKCGTGYKTVNDIPTWEEHFRIKQTSLPAKINILGGFEIDSSKNVDLAKKISTFNGDITTLEVSFYNCVMSKSFT